MVFSLKTVTAALMINDGKVLVAQRADPPKLAGFWEFPGGKLEKGESLEECLIREIHEELNLNISIVRWFGQSIYKYETGAIDLQAFVCKINDGQLLVNTHSDVIWSSAAGLTNLPFLPADVPFVERLMTEGIPNI